MSIISRTLVAAVMAAALCLQLAIPVVAVPKEQLRARDLGPEQLEVLHKLNKRYETCANNSFCYGTTSCCGVWCCYSYQTCYGTSTSDSLAYCSSSIDTRPTSTSYSGTYYGSRKKTGWNSLPLGTRIAIIFAGLVGFGLLAGTITFIVYCCCCKNRRKPKTTFVPRPQAVQPAAPPPMVQPMQPEYTGTTMYTGTTDPHSGLVSPLSTTTPAPPYVPENQQYGAKPQTNVAVNPGPQYDSQTGGYADGRGHVYEAPSGQSHR
ncbi:hypothetical protein FN846DRAFT_1018270 [Sphaerosporella brunnea]|uniref:Uncharacterized protein n=1 Tax=Sphaerosporella brunnea TaxID=1250544 RepID=A0A5J5FBK4_9PEZI|nr:hypothetical protein FN846DRAFT_1018270 [Sphaerosporella brunnea]